MRWFAVLAFACGISVAAAAEAGDGKSGALYEDIRAEDAALFTAYNDCDLKALARIVAPDLEFYHDQTGLSRGRKAFVDAIAKNVCGKVRRDLVPGTLEVYPLKTYGAVEIGEHVFCDPRKTAHCDPNIAGIAKFTMLWQQRGARWTLTRVISYEHVNDWQRKRD